MACALQRSQDSAESATNIRGTADWARILVVELPVARERSGIEPLRVQERSASAHIERNVMDNVAVTGTSGIANGPLRLA